MKDNKEENKGENRGFNPMPLIYILFFLVGIYMLMSYTAVAANSTESAKLDLPSVTKGCAEIRIDASELTDTWQRLHYRDVFGSTTEQEYYGVKLADDLALIVNEGYVYLLSIKNGRPVSSPGPTNYDISVKNSATNEIREYQAKWHEGDTAIALYDFSISEGNNPYFEVINSLIRGSYIAINPDNDLYDTKTYFVPVLDVGADHVQDIVSNKKTQ